MCVLFLADNPTNYVGVRTHKTGSAGATPSLQRCSLRTSMCPSPQGKVTGDKAEAVPAIGADC